jgi:hypothetical protein
MKRQTSVTLAVTTTLILLLLNTAIAQEIIKDKPTPSRAEGAPLGFAYGRDYSTSEITKVVVIEEEDHAGADILFHEAYSFDPKTNPYDAKAPVSVSYMNAFHTSTEQLAGVLKKVNPKLTVLYHCVTFTPWNATDQERGVKEIKQYGYDGVVVQSQDGDVF